MRLVRQTALALAALTLSAQAFAEAPMVLAGGTPVLLKNSFRLTPREVKPGDRFEFKLADHLKVNGVVIVPAGTVGIGEVVKARGNRGFRRSGWVETRPLYVDYGGKRIEFATPDEPSREGHSEKKIVERSTSTTYYHSGTPGGGIGVGAAAAIAGGLIGTIVVLALSRGAEGALEADAPMLGHIRRDTVVTPAGTYALPAASVAATEGAKPAPDKAAAEPSYTAI